METNVISNVPDSMSSDSMSSDSMSSDSMSSDSMSSDSSKMWKYIIFFLILAFLGFNLFTYVGKISKFIGNIIDQILDIFKPILAYFGYGITRTAKTTVDLTATGSKKIIDVAAGTLTGGINVLEKGLNKKHHMGEHNKRPNKRSTPEDLPLPDEAGSLTQANKASRKAGFCYIGEDRGFRSCISVGEGDTCMSGDIFPSMDRCINPSLRSG